MLLLTKAWHYHVTAKLMLMLLSALFTALDSRPIRSSRDGYVAAACHGSLSQMLLYMHMYG